MELAYYQQMMFDYHVKSAEFVKLGAKTTVCLLTVKNGFEIVGTSACVDPADFNEEIGNHFALVDALSKLDGFVGFARQGSYEGLRG
jgi:hypothetical protein